jgi:serine/threonine protein kinase
MHHADCPTEHELTAFNLGDLPGPALDAIAEHLDGCQRCEQRLQQLERDADDVLAALRHAADTPRTEISDGTPSPGGVRRGAASGADPQLPGYLIEGTLGQGGAGIVYRARDRRLGRRVAVKVLRQVTSDLLARFQAEAEAVARLSHPNIIQVYEVGEHQGLSYLVLELAEGGSLAERVGGRPQPVREAAQLVEVLARAVQHAHEAGIVHRDLKPGNVLLARDPAKPQAAEGSRASSAACGLAGSAADLTPKITDFGLAKYLGAPGHTRTGEVMGTPSYMAPEQAEGHTGVIGPAADVWALGAILYELLTARPPFLAETPLTTLLQVLNEEPVPLRQLQPGCRATWRRSATSACTRSHIGVTPRLRSWPTTCTASCKASPSAPGRSAPWGGR